MNTFRTTEIPKATAKKITFRDTDGTYVSIDRAIILNKKVVVNDQDSKMTGYLRFSLKGPSRDVLVLVEPYGDELSLFPELTRSALCTQLEKL